MKLIFGNGTSSNVQNSVVMFTFFRFWPEIPQNSKLFVQIEIGILTNFKYTESNGDVQFFRFRLEIPFLGKFVRKNQNCQFKLKIGI